MRLQNSWLLVCMLLVLPLLHAQEHYGIKFLGSDYKQVCDQFNKAFWNRPKESRFSIVREGENLFFSTNDKAWFSQLFKDSHDGMAIDVVSKQRYDCALTSISNTQIKGMLLPPVYQSRLKRGLRQQGERYRVLVGKIPANLLKEELEFNILFLNEESLCQYYVVYDLKGYPWELLDMGFYLDSLQYTNKAIAPTETTAYEKKTKKLTFVIPFEKNKAEYSQEDIKPIYDSLRLTDFNIKAININAYASVEGSLARNLELQQQRAQSIAAVMQSFQKPTITTTVHSSENWVEFLKDIKGTAHEDLQALSKAEVKQRLNGGLATEMEPILAQHRKAVVALQLERIDKYKDMAVPTLVTNFKEAIAQDQLAEAHAIQNSILSKVRSKAISPDVLTELEVPKQQQYVDFASNNAITKYAVNERMSLIVRNELLELEKIAPNNKRVQYNLLVVTFPLWRYQHVPIKDADFKKDIMALKQFGIAQPLIDRMLVNYHIVKAQQAMQKKDYKTKDASIAYIQKQYSKFPLSDYDYLSLAQFFTYYANIDASIALLENKVTTIDVNEDLLFYYINLTITKDELTQSPDYRAMMLNAYNINPERYCQLFDPYGEGGVTFQLLKNDYLRNYYCENCKQ